MVEFAVSMYSDIMQLALPIGIVFALGNILVGTFMRVAFGGKLWLGK